MTYKEYINLGFKRTDTNDSIVFDETGYYGFCLTKVLSDKMTICVSGEELDRPKLYIKKRLDSSTNHIILLTDEIVRDLLT